MLEAAILGINGTNDANALIWLSPDQLTPSMRAKLMAMALNGDSIVNPLGAAFDYDERTPQGRARKEREQREAWAYRQAMADIEERRAEFQKTLDRLDHVSFEASGNTPMPTLSEQDFDLLRQTPSASTLAPK